MKIRVIISLLRKEIKLMLRNPIIPKMIVAMPIIVMLIIPLVANLEVRNVNVAVVDLDRSQLSLRVVSDMNASESITVVGQMQSYSSALKLMEEGKADVIVTIPCRFATSLSLSPLEIDIEANGVNSSKGMLSTRYVVQSIGETLKEWQIMKGGVLSDETISIINKYNPTLNFRNYMIPALMVVLLIIICGFVPALNLVNEKESGTIEAMNVTPVSRFGFVLSKLIPFWIVGLFVVAVGIGIGWYVYGLMPEGSIIGIFLAAILFSLVMSGLGVTIANTSSTMLQSIFVMFAFIMIFQLMSGLFTPIRSMPEWAQYITYAIPPRYFIEIMRSLYLKDTLLLELLPQYISLAAFAIGLSIIAGLTYRKQG